MDELPGLLEGDLRALAVCNAPYAFQVGLRVLSHALAQLEQGILALPENRHVESPELA